MSLDKGWRFLTLILGATWQKHLAWCFISHCHFWIQVSDLYSVQDSTNDPGSYDLSCMLESPVRVLKHLTRGLVQDGMGMGWD